MDGEAGNQAGRRGALYGDGGFTLIEALVVMVIMVVIGTVSVQLYRTFIRDKDAMAGRSVALSQLQDASTALSRDVEDAQVIVTADAPTLSLFVIRNDVCNARTYSVNASQQLVVRTDFYAQATCSGPTTTRTDVLLDQVTAASPFSYVNTDLVTLTTPVSQIRGISGVNWHLARSVAGTVNGMARDAGAPYAPKATATGNGQQAAQALAPLLSVVTGTTGLEGRDDPALSWVDESPTVTTGWKVFRATWPEGGTQAAWQLLTILGDPSITTYADHSVPAGWTAQYMVQPTVAGGTETPDSNTVTTGLRPAAPVGLVATGQPTSIRLTWSADSGATAYDVYRDGKLYQHLGNVVTYTDATGYGHSHTYRVVGWSRWEAIVLGTTQTTQAAVGDADTATYRSGTARLLSATASAFTAPAAPTVALTANSDWSNTLAWTPAGWVGSGPTSLGGVPRDRGWTGQVNSATGASPTGTWSALWGGAENPAGTTSRVDAYTQAAVAGQWRNYLVSTCNAIGCSPTSAAVAILQRPINPGACTATATSTRAATVTVPRPAQVAPYDNTEVLGGAPAAGYGVTGTGQANQTTWAIDQLAHNTGQTFTVRNHNASPANGGWSDTSSCSTTTPLLAVTTPSVSSTTRTVNASASATNGTSSNITLEGVQTTNGLSATWDPLPQSTGYTVTARNTDGVNAVMAQAGVSTQTLTAPAATCTASVTHGTAPGAITVSGGSQVKLGAAGAAHGSPYSFGSLTGGTYTGYARAVSSDGYNTAYGAWDACPSSTIQTYSTAWGDGVAAGCPGLSVYVGGGASQQWSVRRASDFDCELEWVVTSLGATYDAPAGTIMSTGHYALGSGASAYTQATGSGPFGPLYWG